MQRLSIRDRVDTALGWLLAALMGFAVLNVLWQVFTRYVLDSPSQYTDELARYLLVWIGLLGASYALGKRMHLAVDLLPNYLTGRPRLLLNAGIDTLVLLFALFVMVIGGLRLVSLTLMLEQTSAALRVPLGYVYLALPISGALIVFYSLLFLVGHVRELRHAAQGVGDEPVPHEPRFSERAIATTGVPAQRTSLGVGAKE